MKYIISIWLYLILLESVFSATTPITLGYKPIRPFYAPNPIVYPMPAIPPGTPWPASRPPGAVYPYHDQTLSTRSTTFDVTTSQPSTTSENPLSLSTSTKKPFELSQTALNAINTLNELFSSFPNELLLQPDNLPQEVPQVSSTQDFISTRGTLSTEVTYNDVTTPRQTETSVSTKVTPIVSESTTSGTTNRNPIPLPSDLMLNSTSVLEAFHQSNISILEYRPNRTSVDYIIVFIYPGTTLTPTSTENSISQTSKPISEKPPGSPVIPVNNTPIVLGLGQNPILQTSAITSPSSPSSILSSASSSLLPFTSNPLPLNSGLTTSSAIAMADSKRTSSIDLSSTSNPPLNNDLTFSTTTLSDRKRTTPIDLSYKPTRPFYAPDPVVYPKPAISPGTPWPSKSTENPTSESSTLSDDSVVSTTLTSISSTNNPSGSNKSTESSILPTNTPVVLDYIPSRPPYAPNPVVYPQPAITTNATSANPTSEPSTSSPYTSAQTSESINNIDKSTKNPILSDESTKKSDVNHNTPITLDYKPSRPPYAPNPVVYPQPAIKPGTPWPSVSTTIRNRIFQTTDESSTDPKISTTELSITDSVVPSLIEQLITIRAER